MWIYVVAFTRAELRQHLNPGLDDSNCKHSNTSYWFHGLVNCLWYNLAKIDSNHTLYGSTEMGNWNGSTRYRYRNFGFPFLARYQPLSTGLKMESELYVILQSCRERAVRSFQPHSALTWHKRRTTTVYHRNSSYNCFSRRFITHGRFRGLHWP